MLTALNQFFQLHSPPRKLPLTCSRGMDTNGSSLPLCIHRHLRNSTMWPINGRDITDKGLECIRIPVYSQPGTVQSERTCHRSHHGVVGNVFRQRIARLRCLCCFRQVPGYTDFPRLPVHVSSVHASLEFWDRRAVSSVPSRAGFLRVACCITHLLAAIHIPREEDAERESQRVEDKPHGVLLHRRRLRSNLSIHPGLPLHRPHHLCVDYVDLAE